MEGTQLESKKMLSSVIINTGNVLNLIDIKKKAGQNVVEELSESIKLTLSEWKSRDNAPLAKGHYILDDKQSGPNLTITRHSDDVKEKMAEEERKNFKIGVKIFIDNNSVDGITECLESVLSTLNTDSIDNVIVAYNPPEPPEPASNEDGASNNHENAQNSDIEADTEGEIFKCEALLPGMQVLWTVLEDYVNRGRVCQLGVADIGGGCLRRLYAWARVKPTIAQINLASCCVVPPSLHAFCKANQVQLLTHADPPDLLTAVTSRSLQDTDLGAFALDWCTRYQVHIKCRGVLALKGYVCRASTLK